MMKYSIFWAIEENKLSKKIGNLSLVIDVRYY